MTRSRMTRVAVVVAVLAASSLGCGINRRYANGVIQQLPHSEVNVVYKWTDAPAVALTTAATGESPPAASERTLSIVYPHPNPKYGRRCADVTLRYGPEHGDDAQSGAIKHLVTNPFRQQNDPVGAASSSDPSTMHLLLNREELEFLLRDLVADGFFEPGDRKQTKDGVDLAVTLGSRSTTKSWDRITAFDNLADRVRSESLHANRSKRSGLPGKSSAALLAPTPEADADKSQPNDVEPVSVSARF